MKNINSYIDLVGNFTFLEKEFTEVDNLVFSLLIYVPFKDVVPSFGHGSISLKDAFAICYNLPNFKNTKNSSFIRKVKILFAKISTTRRYKDLFLSNYQYELGDDRQFGAVCITLPNHLMYIAFEGTDDYVSGWEEDFKMACEYPVPSQKLAALYIKKVVKLFGPNVIIGGHSKGGNLALVGAMGLGYLKQRKLIRVYSNDGPGLREKEMCSKAYFRVKDKLINVIPNSSLVGILLKKENLFVIKSRGIGIFQHDAFNWEIVDDHFVKIEQSKKNKKTMDSLARWLESYSDEERSQIVHDLFQILKDIELTSFVDLKGEKWLKLLKSCKNMNAQTKKMLKESILLLATELYGKEKVTL